MNDKAIIKVAQELDVDNEKFTADQKVLVEKVNWLIINDFERLVSILYRIDVSETKINALLKEFINEDAAEIIVNLMLEREAEKIKNREMFKNNTDDGGEERW
jgi:hypothetical protein